MLGTSVCEFVCVYVWVRNLHSFCLCALAFCVCLYCMYHCHSQFLPADWVELVQHTWLAQSILCSPSLLWLRAPPLNQLKQSNARRRGATVPAVQRVLQWHSNLKPIGIGLKCVWLFGYTLSGIICRGIFIWDLELDNKISILNLWSIHCTDVLDFDESL